MKLLILNINDFTEKLEVDEDPVDEVEEVKEKVQYIGTKSESRENHSKVFVNNIYIV